MHQKGGTALAAALGTEAGGGFAASRNAAFGDLSNPQVRDVYTKSLCPAETAKRKCSVVLITMVLLLFKLHLLAH